MDDQPVGVTAGRLEERVKTWNNKSRPKDAL
jgi:hypothetical protein